MGKSLHILIAEDSEEDTLLIIHEIQLGNYEPTYERVYAPEAMITALNKQRWDLVIADYSMPGFSGLEALELLKQSGLDLPFILVSGAIGEDTAVAAMKAGANDYIMKDNLRRLVPAVERALREAETQRQRKRAEARIYRQLQRLAALRDIDMAITASLDLRVTLNVFLDKVTSQLNVNAADVLMFNPHTQTLEYAAGRGFRSEAITKSRLRLGDDYAGRAALERRLVNIPNIIETGDFVRTSLLPDEAFISYYAVPLIAKGQIKGVLEIFHRAPLSPDPEWLNFLETLAGQAAIAIDNSTLFDELQRSNAELALAYDATIEGWSKALDLRDKETEGHSLRVTEMTLRLAHEMGMSEGELVHVRRGALLHDVGKLGIPDSILLKPGSLSDEEWAIMRKHPIYAHEWLLPITYLRPALDIPYCHHEKWDGTGYPRGLKDEQIPLAASIFAVADVYDALRSERPYRPAWPADETREHIRSQSGKHFNPKAVEVFLNLNM